MKFLFRMLILLILTASLEACSGQDPGFAPERPTETAQGKDRRDILEIPPEEVFEAEQAPAEGEGLPDTTPPTEDVGGTRLTLWHGLDDEDALTLKEIIATFHNQQPGIQFELVYVPRDDLYKRYLDASESGEGPSLMLGAGEWGSRLYGLGLVADLSTIVSPALRAEINPAALEAARVQDALVGLPFTMRGNVMYRNRAIIPERLHTYEELVEISQGVTKGGTLGAYLERGDLYALPQMAACGGVLMYPNGFPAFNNLSGVCWFNVLKSFEEAGPVSFNGNEDLKRFQSGKVGIILEGTWNLETLAASLGDDLMIDPWPVYGDHQLSGYVWTENLYANSNLDRAGLQAFQRFCDFFISPQAQGILAKTNQIPAALHPDQASVLVSQAMSALSLGTPFPGYPEMDFYWEPLHNALLAVFEGEEPIPEALQTAADIITKATKDYKNLEEDY